MNVPSSARPTTSPGKLTSFFTPAWLEKNSYLALVIGFGTFAILMIVFTRDRLGYKQTAVPTDITTVLDKYRL